MNDAIPELSGPDNSIPCDGCGKPATIRRYAWLKPTQFFCDDCKGKP